MLPVNHSLKLLQLKSWKYSYAQDKRTEVQGLIVDPGSQVYSRGSGDFEMEFNGLVLYGTVSYESKQNGSALLEQVLIEGRSSNSLNFRLVLVSDASINEGKYRIWLNGQELGTDQAGLFDWIKTQILLR